MSVYVDDMRRPARVGRIDGVWSHLMADSTDELVEFGALLGMKSARLQHPGTWKEHFDVTEPKRQRALRLGAVPIGYCSAESIELMEAKREQRPPHVVGRLF